MDADQLKMAWLILKELIAEKKQPAINNKKGLETRLAKGIHQLNRKEGSDMGTFIDGLKKKYRKN